MPGRPCVDMISETGSNCDLSIAEMGSSGIARRPGWMRLASRTAPLIYSSPAAAIKGTISREGGRGSSRVS